MEASPKDSEKFKKAFLSRFFSCEKRSVNMVEIINIKKGRMSVQKYSLKFTLLSKYAPSSVSNPRDEMSRFFMVLSDLVKKECRTVMLHDEINISRIMVYSKSIDESNHNRKNMELERSMSDEQG